MSTVWCLGSINMDMVATVERHPRPGETVLGQTFHAFPGGKGANQAIAAARAEATVKMVGCVGQDAQGTELITLLKVNNVDVSGIVTLKDESTGTALIAVTNSGENTIIVVAGANAYAALMDDVEFAPGDILLCQFEIPLPAVISAFKRAKQAGALIILNPSPLLKGAEEAIALADILIVNELELATLSGVPVSAISGQEHLRMAAAALRGDSAQTIIVTLGNRGATAFTATQNCAIKGHSVNVVDTTGAGDTFAGALAASLALKNDWPTAMAFANAAAALSVGRMGAASSIPKLADIQNFLKKA